jgi:hypothetical protein
VYVTNTFRLRKVKYFQPDAHSIIPADMREFKENFDFRRIYFCVCVRQVSTELCESTNKHFYEDQPRGLVVRVSDY